MPLTHLKPHGALYGRAARDEATAHADRGRRRGPRRAGARDGRHAARGRLHGPRARVRGRVLRRPGLRRRRLAGDHAQARGLRPRPGARARRPRVRPRASRSRSRAGRSRCARTASASTPTRPAPRSSPAPCGEGLREAAAVPDHGEEPMARPRGRDPRPGDVLPPSGSRQRPVQERGRRRRGRRDDRPGGDHEELPAGGGGGRRHARRSSSSRTRTPWPPGRPSRWSTTANEAGPRRQPRRDRRPHHPRRSRPRARGGGGLQRGRRGGAARAHGRPGGGDRPAARGQVLPRHRARSSRPRATSGAEGVHPGYGFLAERADFASAVEDAGLRYVGPKPEHIALMGDKARAREAAEDAGVPTIPGSDGAVADADEAAQVAGEIGYPVALKAAGGGGGRGIRIVHDEATLAQPVQDRRPRGGGRVRRRAGLRRALRHRGPPRGGPGARRRRADDPPARARVLAPAPAPEGGRGVAGARARGRHARAACTRRPSRCATRSATAARAPWSSSSTPPAASSSSSR